MNLPITEEIQVKLIDYVGFLFKWNLVHNLTAVREPTEMIKRHLLDSLSLWPFLPVGRIIDVGTGAGLPGIPLALSRPESQIVLLDSNQKKITFVRHVILSLKLRNATAICTRVEKYRPDEQFDFVISRAFASLSEFVLLASHLCKKNGKLIAMKGAIDPLEVAAMSADFTIEKIEPVKVPELSASRSLAFIVINNGGSSVK